MLLSAALPVAPMDTPVAEVQNLCAIDIDVNFEINALLNAPLSDLASDRVNSEIRPEENNLSPEPSAEIAEQTAANELVIVDTSVTDFQQFLDEIISENNANRIFQVVTIDAGHNGIDQISDLLSGYEDLDAVHIISHGSDGRIILGDISLDSANLESYADRITAWGNSLSADSDMLFYGCNIAGSSQGQALLTSLADLTGADVAASTDLTSAVSSGGDWDLEFSAGAIEADSLAFESYDGSLAGSPVISNLGGDTAAFTEDGGAIDIDNGSNASVSAGDYDTGYLLINRLANFTANDTLSIDTDSDSDADNTTGIYVSGSEVLYDNVAIGDITIDGTGTNDLRVDFDSVAADEVAVGALLQAIQFNNSAAPPDTTSRTARITVNDGAKTSADNDVTIIVAQNVNITSDGGGATAGVNAAENQTAVTTVTATDADTDTLTFSITGGADSGKFSINSTSGVLTFDAAPDFETPTDSDSNNTYIVEVTASDGNGGTDIQTITVAVTNVNEDPVITSDGGGATAGVNVAENETAVTTVTATDVDEGDTLTYYKVSGPAWLSVATDGTLSGTPDTGDVGLNVFTVRVEDGNGGTDTATLNITVDAVGSQPPSFTSDPINETVAIKDVAYSSSIADDASDPESDTMTFSKVSGPAWLSVASNGDLSGTPGAGDVGANVFTVQVDALGGSDTATLNITVNETLINVYIVARSDGAGPAAAADMQAFLTATFPTELGTIYTGDYLDAPPPATANDLVIIL
ncbi:MAG: DUF4347 domain-containing protein, partial [Planctomycetota bacterium]